MDGSRGLGRKIKCRLAKNANGNDRVEGPVKKNGKLAILWVDVVFLKVTVYISLSAVVLYDSYVIIVSYLFAGMKFSSSDCEKIS